MDLMSSFGSATKGPLSPVRQGGLGWLRISTLAVAQVGSAETCSLKLRL